MAVCAPEAPTAITRSPARLGSARPSGSVARRAPRRPTRIHASASPAARYTAGGHYRRRIRRPISRSVGSVLRKLSSIAVPVKPCGECRDAKANPSSSWRHRGRRSFPCLRPAWVIHGAVLRRKIEHVLVVLGGPEQPHSSRDRGSRAAAAMHGRLPRIQSAMPVHQQSCLARLVNVGSL